MSAQSLWFLENLDVSEIFCPQKMDDFNQSHTVKTYQKGAAIYLPEETSDTIYFINEGRVKIGTYNETGKEITKAILGTGEVFGELALADEEKRRDFAVAMEPTEICVIAKSEMANLMRDHSALHLFFMKIMGSRVLEMEKRLESLVFKDSRTRIVEFLHDYAQKNGQRVGYERVVRRFLTHQDIANLTATSRQTVTTILNELRAKDILTFDRRRLLVRNMELLAAEAVGQA